jgi:hypothetical protein
MMDKELPWICPNHPHAEIRREWLHTQWAIGGWPRGTGINHDYRYYCNDCDLELAPPTSDEEL